MYTPAGRIDWWRLIRLALGFGVFSVVYLAGMPFLLLVGAAPNAIAYESKQFSAGEFFLIGLVASIVLIAVLGLFVWFIWPLMGMAVAVA